MNNTLKHVSKLIFLLSLSSIMEHAPTKNERRRVKMTSEEIIEEWFNRRYTSRLKRSKKYSNLRPITGFIFELSSTKDCMAYIKRIENDLFNHSIIPFKVESINDLNKIENLQYENPEAKRLLWYIWLSMKYEEDSSGKQILFKKCEEQP